MNEEKWISKEIEDTNEGVVFRCWKVVHTEEGGYVDDDSRFTFHRDGSLYVDDTSHEGATLSPEQVRYLRHILWESEKVAELIAE